MVYDMKLLIKQMKAELLELFSNFKTNFNLLVLFINISENGSNYSNFKWVINLMDVI